MVPFKIVGVAFAGPLFLRHNEYTRKSNFVLLTCTVTRAVHLKLVVGMPAGQFLLAFRRFILQREVRRVVISDNAMAFKLPSKELAEFWGAL